MTIDVTHPHHPSVRARREQGGGEGFQRALRAVQRQCNVVFALMIREMKVRYGRSRMGYLMAFVSPTIQKGLLMTVMVFFDRHPPLGPSVLLFYWVGLCSYHMFGFTSNKVIGSLKASRQVRVLPTIMPLDYALTRAILDILTNTIIMIGGLAAIYSFDTEMALPGEPIWVIQSMALMAVFGFGVGLINACISVFYPTYAYVWKSFSGVLMLTSGIFRVPDTLPVAIRNLMAWNPLTHGIELFRMGFYPQYYTRFVDVGYLSTWAFTSLFVGLLMERVLRRRILDHR